MLKLQTKQAKGVCEELPRRAKTMAREYRTPFSSVN